MRDFQNSSREAVLDVQKARSSSILGNASSENVNMNRSASAHNISGSSVAEGK